MFQSIVRLIKHTGLQKIPCKLIDCNQKSSSLFLLYDTIVSILWFNVLKLRNWTDSASRISLGSLSIQSDGTSASLSANTSTLKVHRPSSMGRKVTDAVICLIRACISA